MRCLVALKFPAATKIEVAGCRVKRGMTRKKLPLIKLNEYKPPSTQRICPLINDVVSLHNKNSAAATMSLSLPMRYQRNPPDEAFVEDRNV